MNATDRQNAVDARGKVMWRPSAVAFACAILVANASHAQLPSGGSVTAGQAQISQTATTQTILQSTNKAVIDWRDFSVGANNSVVFVQPSASAVTLNRVIGTQGSSILGSLSANGQVFLVNPNGIFFGANSVLDAAGMVVSTLDIRNEDFLAGRYFFSRSDGGAQGAGVVNSGRLGAHEGGYVFIASDTTTNGATGNLSAPGGTVGLASGSQVSLDLQGDRLLSFSVDQGTASQLVGVDNLGVISADGGRVWISATSARNVAGAVINNSGVIRAAGVEERNGEILLTASGGDVHLNGSLDVSGVQGGAVNINGNNINLGTSATVSADAVGAGNGGRIVLMAENQTWSSGRLSAKGGALGGNGGFVETSAKNVLEVGRTRVDTSAALGSFGQWLLDPTNITIQHGAVTGAAFPGGALSNGGGASSTISDTDINTNLATTNVTISTASGGGGAGTIVLNGSADSGGAVSIVGSNGRDLSLIANAGISFNGGAVVNLGSTSSGGNLLLQAGAGVTQAAGSQIFAKGVGVQGTGTFDLGSSTSVRANKVGVIAANVNGPFSFSNVNADAGSLFSIGAVGAVSGIQTSGGNIAVYSDSTDGLRVDAAVTTGSANTGIVAIQASEATTTGVQTLTLNANVTGGLVKLDAADSLLQSAGVISADNLVVRYAEGSNPDSAALGQANAVGNLAVKAMGTGSSASNGFLFQNTTGKPLTVSTVDGVVGISTKGGNVTLQTDSLNIVQALDVRGVTTSSVFISPTTSTRKINVGTEDASSLSLTQTELNFLSTGPTGLLRVGDALNTGGISLTANVAPGANLTSLSLKTGSGITQVAGTSLGFKNLAVESGSGAVSLVGTNTETGLLAAKTAGSFTYTYGGGGAADLAVDTLDGIDGVNSGGNAIALSATGAISLNKAVNSGASAPLSITAAGTGFSQKAGASITASGLRLTGSGTFIVNDPGNNVKTIAAAITGNVDVSSAVPLTVGTVTVGSNTTVGINTLGGNAKLASDQLTITSAVKSGGGTVTLRALSASTVTELGAGTKGTAGKLELSAAEVGRIDTGAGGLTLGDESIDGKISLVGAFNITGTGPLTLINGNGGIAIGQKLVYGGSVALSTTGAVSDLGGTNGVTAPSLVVSSGTGISLKGSENKLNAVTLDNSTSGTISLANASTALSILSMSQAGGGDISVSNTGKLELTATPIVAVGSNVSLSSGGAMTLLKGIDVGSSKSISLNVAAGGIQQGGGTLTAGSLEIRGVGVFNLANVESTTSAGKTVNAYNDVTTIAADVTGNFTYREKDAITVGTVGSTVGINTHGGSLTLESGGPQQVGGAALPPFGGPMILSAGLNAGGGIITLTANNSGAGGITQTQGALTAASLNVKSGGIVRLDQPTNHVDNIAVQAQGAVTLRDAGATTVNGAGIVSNGGAISIETGGLLSVTQAVNAGSGGITLRSSAGVQQTVGAVGEPGAASGGMRASNLLVLGSGPFTLTNGDNQVGTIAGSFDGSLYYLNAGALTIGSVGGVNGVTSSNAGVIDIRTVNGSLSVNQPVLSAPSGARGDVSLVAGGGGSVLSLNANVRGANVRLNSEGTITQSALSFIDATSLSLGAKNNALNAVPNRSNTPIGELVLYFEGTTTSNEDYFLPDGPSISKLILYGLTTSSSFKLGAGKRILATNLLLTGFGSYSLTNAGNDVDTLAVLRPWGSSSGQNIAYSDVNGFSVGTIIWDYTLSFKTDADITWTWPGSKSVKGIQNNGAWPGYGFGGEGGDVRLTAGGNGAITLKNSIATGGLVALSAVGGVTANAGAGIVAESLKLTGQGAFTLNGPNNVGSIAANITNSGGIVFTNTGDLKIENVDGTKGIQVSGPGATNISVRSTSGDLTVNQEVKSEADFSATIKTSNATVTLRARDDLKLAANVTAQGGATSSGDSASIWLGADVGGVFQTSGVINAVDMGGTTPAAQSPHRSSVQIRAANNSLNAGTAISGAGGKVTLSNVSASSAAGSAVVDVFGPGGITVSGPITVTAQTAPRVNITSDIQDSDKKLKSSRDIRLDGAITVSQPGGADVNKRSSTEPAGLLVSGQNITSTRILSTTGDYGISMFAQSGMNIQADINTTAIAGVALSTGAAAGLVQTTNGARVNAKQLALAGGRDKGIFKITSNVENLQVLGARALAVDNSVYTDELLAVIGRVSEATTDPISGTAIPAADSPVGAASVTTGGQLTILSLNNQSSSSYDLNGNKVSGRRPLVLVSDALVETPGTFKVDPNTEVTLRPFTAARPIVVRNLPSQVPDPNSTYYLAGFVGVLAQLDGKVRLVIGGDGYAGDISVGSQDVPGLFPISEQFSLGSMDIVFSTTGRVYNRFSTNPDSPNNWSSGGLLTTPYSPAPEVFCAAGSACISKITKGDIFIKDSFTNGATQRNIVIKGTGDGSGATSIPPTGGDNGNNGSDGESSSPESGDTGSSGPTDSPSDGAPTGGGNSGTPAEIAQTEVNKSNLQPPVTVTPSAPTGDAGTDTTPLDDLVGDLSPDGGNSSPTGGAQFAGPKEIFVNDTDDINPLLEGDPFSDTGPKPPEDGTPTDTVFLGGGEIDVHEFDDLDLLSPDENQFSDTGPKPPEDGTPTDTGPKFWDDETPINTEFLGGGEIDLANETDPFNNSFGETTDFSNTKVDGTNTDDFLVDEVDTNGSDGGFGGGSFSSESDTNNASTTDLTFNESNDQFTGIDADGTLAGGANGLAGTAGGADLSSADGESGVRNGALDSGVGSGSLAGASDADSLLSSVGGASLSGEAGHGSDASESDTGNSGQSAQFAGLSGNTTGDGLAADGTDNSAVGGGSMSTSGQSGFTYGGGDSGTAELVDATSGEDVTGAGNSGFSNAATNSSVMEGDLTLTSGGALDDGSMDARGGAQSTGFAGGDGRGDQQGTTSDYGNGTAQSLGSARDDGYADGQANGDSNTRRPSAANATKRTAGANDEAFACVADRNQETRSLRATAGQATLTVKGAGVRLAKGSCGDAGAKNSSN